MTVTVEELAHAWNAMARDDAMWSILTDPVKTKNRWEPDEFFKTGEAFITDLMARLESNNMDVDHGSALDFGCGLGRLTRPLASMGFRRVVGVDISEEMIARARQLLPPNSIVEFLVNTEALPVGDASFDYVQSHIVLQHIHPDLILKYLGEFSRVLRQNGMLYFQLPTGLGNSEGVVCFNNPIETSSGVVSMDMCAMPRVLVESELKSRDLVCCQVWESQHADGMNSAAYVARRV